MAPHFHIQEISNGLRVQVQQDIELWVRLFAASLAAVAVGLSTAGFLGGFWRTTLSIAAALVVLGGVRDRRVELQVTKVEFIAKGDIGRRVRKRSVCTGDVRRLEFHEKGGPFSNAYGGLFAVTTHGETCLLPMLDLKATVEVIRAIENKFPGLAEGWRSAS
jgi:hypothetical protein